MWISRGLLWTNVDSVYILWTVLRPHTRYRTVFFPIFRYAQAGYPHFPPLKSWGIRRFVNILVDNAPSYPRLTHSSLLTYPQSYPQMWITAYLQFQKLLFSSTCRLEEHAKKGVYTKWIAHITRDDNRNNHAQHDYAVNQRALLQAFATQRMQAGNQQPGEHASDDESADMRLPCDVRRDDRHQEVDEHPDQHGSNVYTNALVYHQNRREQAE